MIKLIIIVIVGVVVLGLRRMGTIANKMEQMEEKIIKEQLK
jgi:Tfp pilus assembly protein PilO